MTTTAELRGAVLDAEHAGDIRGALGTIRLDDTARRHGWSAHLKTLLAIVLSPVVGFLLALVLVAIVSWASARSTPFAVDRAFRILQFASASLYSLGHGGNDAQKTMGIIAVLLFSQGQLGEHFT